MQVRTDDEGTLARGDQALLVSWDEATDRFTVAPMKDLLGRREAIAPRESLENVVETSGTDDLDARRSGH